ncbi:MAG TPA: NUDIX domain-containing protein [Candidatus Tyrphobacter sp.]|nr:NUDIX domain-containing protein [Candidatus Tyrphobacter sp.]
MKVSTLCFAIKDNEILLGMKKRGFGAGKWNGFGGKVSEGEGIGAAAARELAEESSLAVEEKNLEPVALLNFFFEKEWVFQCHVFLVRNWMGSPLESEEMKPQWFQIKNLPFDEMWIDDREWLPLVLSGKTLEADFYFNSDGSAINDFNWKEKSF